MAEHIEIAIWTNNAAFEDAPASEVARILRKLADDFEQRGEPAHVIRDINGNLCGEVRITRDAGEEG